MKFLIVTLSCLMSCASYAQMYQCEVSSGVKTFQSQPCESDRVVIPVIPPQIKGADLDIDPVDDSGDVSAVDPCSGDTACITDKYLGGISAVCPPIIERMANYGFEWTNGWTGLKFYGNPTPTATAHIYRFSGDSLKMQNGYGAWANVIYSCDVDVVTGNIVDASVVKGWLPAR